MIVISIIIIVKKTTCCGCVSLFLLSFLKLYPYYMVFIYTHTNIHCCVNCGLLVTIPHGSRWGGARVALTFDGKLMSAGPQIPIMCIYSDPEGSLHEMNVEYGCCQCDTKNSSHLCFRYNKFRTLQCTNSRNLRRNLSN